MPNTIHRRGNRTHYEEANALGTVLPGHLLELTTDDASGRPRVQKHSTFGGRHMSAVAWEDSLRGMTKLGQVQGTATLGYGSGDLVRYHQYATGDAAQYLLAAGQNVTKNDWLISNGDGTLTKAPSEVLLNNTARSTATGTSSTAENTFSTGTGSIPANSLKVGDRIRIRGHGVFPATNSTDTATIKVNVGGAAVATGPAVDVANNDVFRFDITGTVRSVGATGKVVFEGDIGTGVPGTATMRAVGATEATLDTTAAIAVTVTNTFSVSNAGNEARLETLSISKLASGSSGSNTIPGMQVVGQAEEDLDLSVAVDAALIDVRFAA